MTRNKKISIIILALTILIIAIWLFAQQAKAPSENWTINNQNSGNTQTEVNDENKNSDAVIEKDLTAINEQMKELDTDISSIDESLNDQPIEQEQ